MDSFKKVCRMALFPHILFVILLTPIATAMLVLCLIRGDDSSPFAIISYVASAYTLTAWCVRIPSIVKKIKAFKAENIYAVRLSEDIRFRINISLLCTSLWNVAYSVFLLYLGVLNKSFWFYSLAVYYMSLCAMRIMLGWHTRRYDIGERLRAELKKYRACGWIFLVLNLALFMMVFFMVYFNRTFEHGEIVTIAMAAYTFGSLSMAIVSVLKYRKKGSPVLSASKLISLAAASVSMLTLSATMLNTFGGNDSMELRRILLAVFGGLICVSVVAMAIYMIVKGTKQIKTQTEIINEATKN